MAKNSAETLHKRSSKFESFLKKNLNEDTFDSIRAYESCIVCSDRENKAFKFTVLTSESIYLTENPPKTIYEAIQFKDVVSVELVNDLPNFLSGQERENTQHINVTYWTEVNAKNKKPNSVGRNSPKNLSPREFQRSYSDITSNQRRHQYHMTKSRSSAETNTVSKDDLTVGWTEDDEDLLNSSSLSNSMPSQLLHRLGIGDKSLHPTSPRSDTSPRPTSPRSDKSQRPLSARSDSSQGDKRLRHHSNHSDKEASRPLPRLQTSKSEQYIADGFSAPKTKSSTRSAMRLTTHTDDSGIGTSDDTVSNSNGDVGGATRSSMGSSSSRRTSRQSSLESNKTSSIPRLRLDSQELETDDETFENCENNNGTYREAVLHLYMLSSQSPMMVLVKSAWLNFSIRSTLLLDPVYIDRIASSPRRKIDSEKITLLYNQLKRELLTPANNMEKTFELMFELQSATEKNFQLKRLFWKAADLFSFIIKQLQRYLPKSSLANLNSPHGRTQRADEFELVIVLVDTLSLMFRETEILPSRLHCLKAGKGKAALDLLIVLTCFPEVPQKYIPPSSKAAVLLNSSQADQWKCQADIEISKLMTEFSNISTTVLFELILIAEQGNWGESDGSFFNICWMIKVLEELRTTTKFVESVVGRAMRLIAPSKQVELTPREAILVFQQFYVLHTFTKYSPQIESHIRNNFTEEFKYFIQAPLLAEKLPTCYPITKWTLQVIEAVTARILEKPFKLKF